MSARTIAVPSAPGRMAPARAGTQTRNAATAAARCARYRSDLFRPPHSRAEKRPVAARRRPRAALVADHPIQLPSRDFLLELAHRLFELVLFRKAGAGTIALLDR